MFTFSTTRHDGISSPPWNSFNLSYGVGDSPQKVAANRDILKKRYSLKHIMSSRQIHGDNIMVAAAPITGDTELDGYDAIMTDQMDVSLLIQQADCQAITLFDPERPAIAAIHCGWKGSVANIIAKTVKTMTSHYDTDPAKLLAVISPSLGPCCAEFINHQLELPDSFKLYMVKKNHFDFWQISNMQLTDAGLLPQNIQTARICTSCSKDYFSYRRASREKDGTTGRCATVITL